MCILAQLGEILKELNNLICVCDKKTDNMSLDVYRSQP